MPYAFAYRALLELPALLAMTYACFMHMFVMKPPMLAMPRA